MTDRQSIKKFFYGKVIAIIRFFIALIFANHLCAATLQVGNSSVILTAGQTIEVPLYSSKPISGDLTAKGAFQSGDVSFTPSPNCHLSAHHCSLLIRAALTSKKYTAVPIVVSASGVTNTPVFSLSVIHPGEARPINVKLPEINPTNILLSNQIGSEVEFAVTNTTAYTLSKLVAWQLPSGVHSSMCSSIAPGKTCMLKLTVNDVPETGHSVITINSDQGAFMHRVLAVVEPIASHVPVPVKSSTPIQTPIQKSGNTLFYGMAEPHPGLTVSKNVNNDFTSFTNGPAYQIIKLTNNDVTQSLKVAITGTGASSFSLDNQASNFGANQNCATLSNIPSRESCLVIIKGKIGDPNQPPARATLTIQGDNNNVATFTLTDTTYVYAAGGFNTLGNASVSGGSLLAECTAGTCSNALQGSTGNNYASANFSVGQWINALVVTSNGNLIVGGGFGAIGGAVSGANSGTAALLAQCKPGAVSGNACINQINGTSNSYAFNNAYINAITAPFAISSSSFIGLGGDFRNIRNATTSGRMLAKCSYNGGAPTPTCSSYLTSSQYANGAIAALNTLGSTSSAPKVNAGGLFTQIAGYPSSAPSSGTTFATCSTSACSQGMGANAPNNSILGMSDDGSDLYMGGTFTQIGGYVDSNGGYPLVKCTLSSPTTCANALAGSNDANGYIEGLAYSAGNLYVGGNFTTIGGATPVIDGNMLAVCTPGDRCSNVVTDAQNYATGPDWGGGIFAIAVGSQVSIAAN